MEKGYPIGNQYDRPLIEYPILYDNEYQNIISHVKYQILYILCRIPDIVLSAKSSFELRAAMF